MRAQYRRAQPGRPAISSGLPLLKAQEEETTTETTMEPVTYPTEQPTEQPTLNPTEVTTQPTEQPTLNPTEETTQPTEQPTLNPTEESTQPTEQPTLNPTEETIQPTELPTVMPITEETTSPIPGPITGRQFYCFTRIRHRSAHRPVYGHVSQHSYHVVLGFRRRYNRFLNRGPDAHLY